MSCIRYQNQFLDERKELSGLEQLIGIYCTESSISPAVHYHVDRLVPHGLDLGPEDQCCFKKLQAADTYRDRKYHHCQSLKTFVGEWWRW